MKHYFGESSRDSLPDILATSYEGSTISTRWTQCFSFACKEVRKRKGCDHIMCPFCVRVVYDRAVGGYVFKVYRLSHLGHAVNFSSIVGHIKFEADFMVSKTEEKRYNDVKQIFDST